ncbi:hypothetical protein ACS0TY_004254 [Phlomoides rotata]
MESKEGEVVGKYSDRGKNNLIEAWKPERGCVTFFFSNFPNDCGTNDLFGKFKEYGIVKDIFIPNKLDKNGRKYGFVRFGGEVNTVEMEQNLNSTWVGSYKIRANISKFTQKSVNSHRGGASVGRTVTRSSDIVAETPRRDDRMSSECDRKFLKLCFMGQLKQEHIWTDIAEEIQEFGEGKFQAKYRGGDLVIDSKDLEPISKWFEFLDPWSERDAHNVRFVWTQWFGVPMHAWNPKFFKLISLKFGKMISIDENTTSKKNV